MHIKELLAKEQNSEHLTDEEKQYLKQYKKIKLVKHSQNFTAHTKKMLEE